MNAMTKKVLQNIAIVLLALIGIKNLLSALPYRFLRGLAHLNSHFVSNSAVAFHQVLSFLLGLLILLLVYRVYKRVQIAWAIEMVTLSVTITVHLIHYRNSLNLPVLLAELFAWVVLGLSHRDFRRIPDKMTVIKALAFVSASVVLVLLNATLGIFMLKEHFTNIKDICDALVNSVKLLIFMDTGFLSISGRVGHIYADSLISINWICIIASAVLVLKPLVYDYIENIFDKERVQRLVSCYGQNPIAYLALENDKRYLFGKNIEGVCPYQVVGNVFVVCGDMICDKKDGFLFLNEILSFCNQNGYKIIFLNITDAFFELYKMAGFGLLKYGEDACFRLADYNLAGGRVAKVRAAINHANKAGITVIEYKPLVLRDPAIENQISDITKEWLSNKGGFEMSFMLGGTGLENPLSRRYFYAADNEGKMLGFIVFLPYLSGKGYLADVTRRRSDSPQGVLEKITYDAFMQMKEEGVVWGNMGLSPLYNVAANDKAAIPEKLFNYIYKNMNNSYGFKALHHAKEKYAPTEWQPRYLAYSPRLFTPNLAYAIVRVQLGKKLPQVVLKELGKKRDGNDK